VKSSNKVVNEILRACEKADVPIRKTSTGHYQIYTPLGGIVTISSSPRSKSACKKNISMLRKGGVDI
jgi:hypothetical protein